MIRNIGFAMFASHDNQPDVENPVLAKPEPISWTIQLVQNPNIYV